MFLFIQRENANSCMQVVEIKVILISTRFTEERGFQWSLKIFFTSFPNEEESAVHICSALAEAKFTDLPRNWLGQGGSACARGQNPSSLGDRNRDFDLLRDLFPSSGL